MSAGATAHPSLEMISLYAAGDLPWFLHRQTSRHMRGCEACQEQMFSVRSALAELRRDARTQVLTGFEAIADWHTLENDMLGNIRVGLAAARCIENVGRGRRVGMRLAWGAGMAALFMAGWVARVPAADSQRIVTALRRAVGLEQMPVAGTVLRSTPNGISVKAQGATLTILHPQSAVVSMSGPGSVTARYVDDDSGQVTISNVYGQ